MIDFEANRQARAERFRALAEKLEMIPPGQSIEKLQNNAGMKGVANGGAICQPGPQTTRRLAIRPCVSEILRKDITKIATL